MSDWAVGLSTGSFYRSHILEGLPLMHGSGFELLEISSFGAHLDYHDLDAVRRAAGRIRELGMEPFSFHAPFSAQIDITSLDPEQPRGERGGGVGPGGPLLPRSRHEPDAGEPAAAAGSPKKRAKPPARSILRPRRARLPWGEDHPEG